MQTITGYVERLTYQNPENGFTVARLQEPGKRELTCIVGTLPTIQPGETLACHGSWKNDSSHGWQFQVARYETCAPADVAGIKKYLGSGLIKGVGPVYAERIVEKFGTDTLAIIDGQPERLTEIAGIGRKRIEKIKACWEEQRAIREVMLFLQQYGVSPTFAQKIFRTYGEHSVRTVSEDPYALANDIFGIGFKTADGVAEKMGIAKDDPKRVRAGIEFVLNALSNDGHVCYPREEFLDAAQAMLEVSREAISAELARLASDERIVMDNLQLRDVATPYVWLKALHMSEVGIAREIERLLSHDCKLREVKAERAVEWVQGILHIELALNQQQAVIQALCEKVQVITGGPGTGKSTITKAILAITEKLSSRILLAAPTGRAAKRMAEICGRQAQTIHSLLEFDFTVGGFKKGRKSPLECDLLIVDEASMIDTALMYSLLKAVPNSARVIFVGDINQLPSVGPGNVLKDLIQSRLVPVTQLTEIFRQARGSKIITNAHRINSGEFPSLRNPPDSDFFFIEAEDKEGVQAEILSLVTRRLSKKYGFDRINDIQVLAPMRRGDIGTENLNELLQKTLNPSDQPLVRGLRRYHVQDKVMQIRNNYKKEVFNGDVGRITKIDFEDQELLVCFEGRDVLYDFTELDELVLAYAVSVHKYQGSECPCIVMPVHTSHFKLLHRNLLYTGVTRGKKLVVLVGTKKAVAIAVHNNEVLQRHTGLRQALQATVRSGRSHAAT